MASISSVSGSNTTSSLYNSSNIISGLASGLDTEGMIEGLVQSYQTKIQTLQNKITKTEWKQEAYRSIISKMNTFANKYTSYTSNTNLMSSSFFSNAINVAAQGKYADKVTASGRTDSDVRLNGVSQLATAARYTTRSKLNGITDDFSILAESGVSFDDTYTMGALSGSLSLKYGGSNVSVVFDQYKDIIPETKTVTNDDGTTSEVKLTSAEKAEKLAQMIQDKLADSQITLTNGESKAANELIDVKFDGKNITFSDKSSGKNTVYISGASGNVESALGLNLDNADEDKPATINTGKITNYVKKTTVGEHISGKTMNLSLDGKTKSITMPRIGKKDGVKVFLDDEGNVIQEKASDGTMKNMSVNADNYASLLQKSIDEKFGVGKIKVSNESGSVNSLQLKIKAPDNSDLIINTDAGDALGIGNSATNYLSTNKTLGELLPEGTFKTNYDNEEQKQDFILNGVKIGSYDSKTKLSEILNDINNNTEAGVKVTFSQTTRQFNFTTKDTGVETKIEMGEGLAQQIFGTPADVSKLPSTHVRDLVGSNMDIKGEKFSVNVDGKEVSFTFSGDDPTFKNITDKLASTLNAKRTDDEISSGVTYEASLSDSGALRVVRKEGDKEEELSVSTNAGVAQNLFASINSYTAGQDSVFEVEVNGQKMQMTRPSNSANIDGMTLNFKGTFQAEEGEAVTFSRTTDSDKIVDAVRSMVNDYNEMMSEIRSQYATLPYQKSNGSFANYEPLSDEDRATMSESAIAAYEEKAKQGILFGDRNLTDLYEKMRGIFTGGTTDQAALRDMGISVSYSSTDGSAQLTLDEKKLRAALDSDPDAVADAFTRVGGDGQSPGIMQSMKTQLDRYAGLTGATKGILVQTSGTPLNSLSMLSNTWQTQIDNVNDQIEKWQDKLSTQVDKYTSMFSKLEVLIAEMNSQSSTLAGLMGGSSY